MLEQTFFIIKPNALERGLVGEIFSRIEKKGLKITKLELVKLNPNKLKAHYNHIVNEAFYPELEEYMTKGNSIIGILTGDNAISTWRKMMGATNPREAELGSIRGDLGTVTSNGVMKNLVHGSDSVKSATNEINIWF